MFYELLESSLTLKVAASHVADKLNAWGVTAVKMLPNLVVALVVLFIIWVLSIPAERLVKRGILRLSRQTHMADLLGWFARLTVIMLGIVLALDAMNLDKAVASLLAGAGIIGVAIGFASKDIAANFMAGILLHFIHPFHIGDFVKSGDIIGYIQSLEMRSTRVRNQQGQIITIPNQSLLGSPIINFTTSGVRRVDLPWSLTQVEDLEQAEELAIKAVEGLELRNPKRPVELFYEKVGDYTIDFEIRFWTDPNQQVYLKARSDAIKAIKRIYEEHGIPMPSPVRVLDFGIVGGTPLKKQLQGLELSVTVAGEQSAGKAKEREETEEIKEKGREDT